MVAHFKLSSVCLVTLFTSLAAAEVHGADHHVRHLAQFGAGTKEGFQMLNKRQAAGGRAAATSAEDTQSDSPTSAAATSAATQAATSAAAVTTAAPARSSNLVDSILDPLTGNNDPTSSAAVAVATEATSAAVVPTSAAVATTRASVDTSAQTSAETDAETISAPSSAAVVVVTTRLSSLASSASLTSSASASATAAADKKETSSSGLSKPALIIIIAVASSVALIAAIWTIVRKTAFGTSKRFDKKLRPISEFETTENQHSAIPGLDRSNSSAVGPGGMGYAQSLGRSDSGKGSIRNDGYPQSIAYNGPAYSPAPYYGGNQPSPAFNQGYPQQQAYGYTDLQRGATGRSYTSQNSAGAYDFNQQQRFQPRY